MQDVPNFEKNFVVLPNQRTQVVYIVTLQFILNSKLPISITIYEKKWKLANFINHMDAVYLI